MQPGLSVNRGQSGGEQAVNRRWMKAVEGGGGEGGGRFVSLVVAASSDWRPGAAPTPVLP